MESHNTNMSVSGQDHQLIVREISSENNECETAFQLIDKENWDVPFASFKTVFDFFKEHIFVLEKGDTKEILGLCTAIPSHPGQNVLGNIIIRSGHRRKGLGTFLLNQVIRSHKDRTMTLTAVPGAEHFYKKRGFQEIEPLHHVMYISPDRERIQHECDDVQSSKYHKEISAIEIKAYSSGKIQFDDLNRYDTAARGYDCHQYLRVMTSSTHSFLVATTSGGDRDEDGDGKTVVGYARGVGHGDVMWIDGMYADSDAIALALMRELLDKYYPSKKEVRIQTIQPRFFLIQFGRVLPKSKQYIRMCNNPPTPPVTTDKLYAVTECDYAE